MAYIQGEDGGAQGTLFPAVLEDLAPTDQRSYGPRDRCVGMRWLNK